MPTVIGDILARRLIAIIRLDQPAQALEIVQALLAGGISLIEFTLTGEGAIQAIGTAREFCGDLARIGAGAVLNAYAATEAINAGAEFIVTPVVRPGVIEICRLHTIPTICGALTPTEALTAHEAGAQLIKIFPAHIGGPSYMRELLAPLPDLRLVPTGGISVEHARDFLDAGAVALGIEGELLTSQVLAQGDWDQVTARARRYVEAIA